MKRNEKTGDILFSVIGALVVSWIALLTAPYVQQGLIGIIKNFGTVMENPFRITWCEDSLKSILVFLLLYSAGIAIWLSGRKNLRTKEEHGSARWGNPFRINRKYAQKPLRDNRILTQNVKMGLNDYKHKRNLNVMVVGGSGAGKTRYYAKPNLMQGSDCSFVVLDPKGELCRSTGRLLERNGYEVKVLDLINMQRSHCYNPLMYVRNDNDAQKLVTNLFQSTMPKGQKSSDPFWDISAQMLLMALIFLLLYEAPVEEQNFAMVLELLRAASIEDEENPLPSPLDRIFMDLEKRKPGHIACKYYSNYHSGSAKTLKSVQITLAARLEKFNLDSLASLTMTDELELDQMGEKKVALFAIIPDNDTSLNFLVSILYTQLFQQLFYEADHVYGGKLPVPVHFLMDEFANVSLPSDFDKDLATMRSRGVSVSIILQNMAQLKALFEKEWESISGNCDTFLYLGGNEQSTHKYVSELLGKETIDVTTHNRTKSNNPSYGDNYNLSGRELLDASEVRLLDNQDALLFIRGEPPVMDKKYDLEKHPNYKLTADGNGRPYVYGESIEGIASIQIEVLTEKEEEKPYYEFITEDELEGELSNEEKEGEHHEQEQHEQKTKDPDGSVDGAGTDGHVQSDSTG